MSDTLCLVQEPVLCSGHICHFEDMQVISVLLDEIMKDPENPTEDLVLQLDIKVPLWVGNLPLTTPINLFSR